MSNIFFLFGRHPELSLAELMARLPNASLVHSGAEGAVLNNPETLSESFFDQLGGSQKMIELIESVDVNDVVQSLADQLEAIYRGNKLDYGLSVYGLPEAQLRPWLLALKKELRLRELKGRFINNQFRNISAAQYKSIKEKGIELAVVYWGQRYWVGKVTGVQNIDAYAIRDYEKPFRDMKMGMLPPKLAQMLINLTGVDGVVWDPFCGSGTVLMEGLLMGHAMVGSDLNPRHVDGALQNVDWIRDGDDRLPCPIFVHDATHPIPDILLMPSPAKLI
ncbi:hypothetical protein IPJ72_01980 [Candidatus Peregrinibacteria bacterium]|nr:MAG: hypothetical protein IPJ72_01980 [Candidatus Peregrinibacteria bacterium]